MEQPQVGIIMGSQSDWPTMREAASLLDELGVAHERASSRPIAPPTGSGRTGLMPPGAGCA